MIGGIKMARSIKIKGKDALLSELQGKTFHNIERKLEGGTHQIWFYSNEVDFCLWGAGCCCDVAKIDRVDGDLSELEGLNIDGVEISGPSYKIDADGKFVSIKWYSKHPGFLEQGVKLIKRFK